MRERKRVSECVREREREREREKKARATDKQTFQTVRQNTENCRGWGGGSSGNYIQGDV